MRRLVRPLLLAAFALTTLLGLGTGQARAHGSGWSQESLFAVVLSFYYADQTPIPYAEVEIFSPADSKIPYQKGRSDKNGFFAFRPDAAGLWSFSAADGQGHLSRGEVEVTAEQLNHAPIATPLAQGGASADGVDPLKIILGLSLLANLALFFLRKRKKGN